MLRDLEAINMHLNCIQFTVASYTSFTHALDELQSLGLQQLLSAFLSLKGDRAGFILRFLNQDERF